jgi:hypothetical protein
VDAEKVNERRFMIRIKKKKINPKNEYILEHIKIRKKLIPLYKHTLFWKYFVIYPIDGEDLEIASAYIQPDEDFVSKVEVHKDFRRYGIATELYNAIEKDLNIKLRPVKIGKAKGPDPITLFQDPDGAMFWQNRLKKQNPTDKSLLSKIQIQKELIKIPKDKFRPRNR